MDPAVSRMLSTHSGRPARDGGSVRPGATRLHPDTARGGSQPGAAACSNRRLRSSPTQIARREGPRGEPRRWGAARRRTPASHRAETPVVLLLDAHMRFYGDDWWRVIEDAVSSNPRSLYSMRCRTLHPSGERTGAPDGLGAWVHLETDANERDQALRAWSLLSPAWNLTRRSSGPIETVPCVKGGAKVDHRGGGKLDHPAVEWRG